MQVDLEAADHIRRVLRSLDYGRPRSVDAAALASAQKLAYAARAAGLKQVPVPTVWPPPIVANETAAELKRQGYSEGYGETYSGETDG